MKIEHVALLVVDPPAMARWYEQHLGLRTVRSSGPPGDARFLADEEGESVLEIYRGELPAPDYAVMDPALLHVAFATRDVGGTRARLIAAGATPVGEIKILETGDEMAMLRDPWGLAVQLANRARPLVP
jgi:catechol 2,3-dioxygenase-like lactoylglutathione lyase family enzyme